jgi:integrase
MAKLQEYRAGKFRFKLRGKYFYLPGLTKRDAEGVQERVEKLASAKLAGSVIPDRIAAWLGECADELYEKLVEIKLVDQRRQRQNPTVLGYADEYIERKAGKSKQTQRNLRQACEAWAKRHPAGTLLQSVTAGDADRFYESLLADHKSSTATLYLRKMREIFKAALRDEVINRNPLADIRSVNGDDSTENVFVERATIDRLLDHCPDAEWRLLVVLSRYAGLRCPSESDVLEWSDVDLVAEEITIRSTKTGVRRIPLFPELLQPLRDVFDPEARFVLQRHRGDVRSSLSSLIGRAGIEPWPRVFHSLRASRESELANEFPIHVAAAWIGNSVKVAAKHYLKVTPEQMEQAKGGKGRARVAHSGKVAETK